MSPADPVRDLQLAAVAVARRFAPHVRPGRVVVVGVDGAKVLDVVIPPTLAAEPVAAREPVEPAAGWEDRGGRLYFDGVLVSITGRKLDVLRVLIEKEPATVKDLRAAWGGYEVEENTIRWTVGELKKALKVAFPDFDGEPVPPHDGDGYRLAVR